MDRAIIRLERVHRTAAVATLAEAFQDDPAVAFMMPDSADRRRRLPRMFAWLFDETMDHGYALGTPGCEVVTLWRAPGKVHHHSPIWHPHRLARLLWIFGPAILRAARVGDAIDANVPAGENWHYLRYAGVRPDCQGKGLGGLAIRHGMGDAEAAGLGTLLETATPANVGIYLRLGFSVTHEYDVPGPAGPHFWAMRYHGAA